MVALPLAHLMDGQLQQVSIVKNSGVLQSSVTLP